MQLSCRYLVELRALTDATCSGVVRHTLGKRVASSLTLLVAGQLCCTCYRPGSDVQGSLVTTQLAVGMSEPWRGRPSGPAETVCSASIRFVLLDGMPLLRRCYELPFEPPRY